MPLLLASGSSQASCMHERIYIYASENITYTLCGPDRRTDGWSSYKKHHPHDINCTVCRDPNSSPGNFMSPSKLRASTNIYCHLAEQKRVQLVISLYGLLFICIKSLVMFLTLFVLRTRYLT